MKLTNKIKDDLLKLVLDESTKDMRQWLKDESHEIATSIYHELYPEKIRQQMAQLPEDFFQQASSFNAICPKFLRYGLKFSCKSSVRVGAKHQYDSDRTLESQNPELLIKVDNWIKKDESHKSFKEQLQSEMKSLLARVNTDNQLKEAWPEGEKYWSQVLPDPASGTKNLPVKNTVTINQLLSLV